MPETPERKRSSRLQTNGYYNADGEANVTYEGLQKSAPKRTPSKTRTNHEVPKSNSSLFYSSPSGFAGSLTKSHSFMNNKQAILGNSKTRDSITVTRERSPNTRNPEAVR